jgi:hypothetical protein
MSKLVESYTSDLDRTLVASGPPEAWRGVFLCSKHLLLEQTCSPLSIFKLSK